MRKMSLEDENKMLRKQNRILKRQLGDVKKQLKINVPSERAKWYQEGYETARNQLKGG